MRRFAFFLLCATAFSSSAGSLTETYREAAARLIGEALTDHTGYAKLAWLCDRIGNRLAGSTALNEAIRWAAEQMRKDGLTNIQTPSVKVPHWVRGNESLTLIAPVSRKLPMLGLGRSVGTPPDGITASVLAVSSFDELERLGRAKVQGKIVLYNVPYEGYGKTVQFRASGATRAAKLGAVAALVRSVGSATLRTPHTGALLYAAGEPKIPAAAITIEDAMMLQRMLDSGAEVRVHLNMEAHELPDADSANVIAEIPGTEKPEEVVVMGGHIDSWDVGEGAQDDGSGCVAAMQAAHLIRKLGLKPKRTIRVVLWTNEENGLAGSRAYRQWIGPKIANHIAAIEMDGGSERPIGFDTQVKDPAALARLAQITALLKSVGASQVLQGGPEADISPVVKEGVPGLGLRTVMEHYFDWHHTEADTVDKINERDFQANVASLAVMAYVLADMPERLQP